MDSVLRRGVRFFSFISFLISRSDMTPAWRVHSAGLLGPEKGHRSLLQLGSVMNCQLTCTSDHRMASQCT